MSFIQDGFDWLAEKIFGDDGRYEELGDGYWLDHDTGDILDENDPDDYDSEE